MPQLLESSSRPELSRHIRLTFDQVRDQHVLLGPEAVVVLNPTGAAILSLCDGQRTVSDIVDELSSQYDDVAPTDVHAFLERLVTKRHIRLRDP